MKDRQNRDVEAPRDRRPKAEPSMKEKDTLQEREYDDKAGKNTPGGRPEQARKS